MVSKSPESETTVVPVAFRKSKEVDMVFARLGGFFFFSRITKYIENFLKDKQKTQNGGMRE
jgi:hypothetical protein